MLTTVLIIIWFGIPLIYTLFVMYVLLESYSTKKKSRGEENKLLTQQSMFLWGVGVFCYFVNTFFLIPHATKIIPEILPQDTALMVVQLLLFPFVAFLGSLIVGGSKAPKLAKTRTLKTMESHRTKSKRS